MRKESRLLRAKALDSLVLAVELFNRPSDRGRSDAVLISLDHSFEMLLKASIVHRGGRIRVCSSRFSELYFCNLALNHLAEHVEMTSPRTLAVVRALGLQEDKETPLLKSEVPVPGLYQ